jgi:hypothetical protein
LFDAIQTTLWAVQNHQKQRSWVDWDNKETWLLRWFHLKHYIRKRKFGESHGMWRSWRTIWSFHKGLWTNAQR